MSALMLRNYMEMGSELPGGLVRMDRAALYLRGQLAEIFVELQAKGTKSIGESTYRINSLGREMMSIGKMASESSLIRLARELISLGERSPRQATIQKITSVISILEEFENERRSEEEEALVEHRRMLEERLGSSSEGKTPISVADSNAVFIIMPFRQEFNDVWKGAIQKACTELGLHAIRVDMINRSSNITDDIVQSIEACHVVIADVTENNPNVMFELGYAIARTKPNIIISQSSDFLPFDIRHLRTIVYANTWSGVEDLRSKLVTFLKEALPQTSPSVSQSGGKPTTRKHSNK